MKAVHIIICVLCLALLWAGPAAAVDKTKKDKTPPKEKSVEVEKRTDTGKQQIEDKKPDPGQSRSKKSYDSFIDNNNNGIDDRAEKKVSVKKTKPDTVPESPSGKNP